MLFSGDQYYESKSVDITSYRMDFTMNSIKTLNQKLEPPIGTAYRVEKYLGIILYLVNVSQSLDLSLVFCATISRLLNTFKPQTPLPQS